MKLYKEKIWSKKQVKTDRDCRGSSRSGFGRLVLNKPIYLKVVYRDPYQRLVSFVYSGDGKSPGGEKGDFQHRLHPVDQPGQAQMQYQGKRPNRQDLLFT